MDVEQKFDILIAGDDQFQEGIRQQLFNSQYSFRSVASNKQIFALMAQRHPHFMVIQFDAPALIPFQIIEEILKLTKWNRTKAADILGVSRPRLKRKIDEYHIDA